MGTRSWYSMYSSPNSLTNSTSSFLQIRKMTVTTNGVRRKESKADLSKENPIWAMIAARYWGCLTHE